MLRAPIFFLALSTSAILSSSAVAQTQLLRPAFFWRCASTGLSSQRRACSNCADADGLARAAVRAVAFHTRRCPTLQSKRKRVASVVLLTKFFSLLFSLVLCVGRQVHSPRCASLSLSAALAAVANAYCPNGCSGHGFVRRQRQVRVLPAPERRPCLDRARLLPAHLPQGCCVGRCGDRR